MRILTILTSLSALVFATDKSELILGRGESAFVERNCHHRIENISSVEPLEIIEVQTGDYLGEDDIVRIEDDYGR